MYKLFLQPLLFRFDAEKAHYFTFDLVKALFKIPFFPSIFRAIYQYENPALEKTVFGLKFKNPVGLAAGLDKNAVLVDELSAMGFGFVEIGTLTPKPQPGNDKPRLFRLKADEALINRMGFNNDGVKEAAARLRKRKSRGVVMDGRDIGTKVFPDAEVKVFMTADPVIRAERRQLELLQKGEMIDLEEILENLKKRDIIDSTREEGPLVQAEEAVVLVPFFAGSILFSASDILVQQQFGVSNQIIFAVLAVIS